MKTCSRCGETKPLESFGRNKECRDGRRNTCKACQNVTANSWRHANPDRVRAYWTRYEAANRDKVNARHRAWRAANPDKAYARDKRYSETPNGKAVARKAVQAYRQRLPLRNKAVWMLNHALNAGKITKLPCFVCGAEDTQGHHPDYSHPLDVVWLCRAHHLEIHFGKPVNVADRVSEPVNVAQR